MGWLGHYARFRSRVLLQRPAEEVGAGRSKGEDRYQTWGRMAKVEEICFLVAQKRRAICEIEALINSFKLQRVRIEAERIEIAQKKDRPEFLRCCANYGALV